MRIFVIPDKILPVFSKSIIMDINAGTILFFKFLRKFKHLFAIFITRQLTGNIKESIIPYIFENLKQIKLIKTSKKDDQDEPSSSFVTMLNNLQTLSIAKQRSKNKYIGNETTEPISEESVLQTNNDISCLTNLSQPEVESIMPRVGKEF
jgi:hypothetical protein